MSGVDEATDIIEAAEASSDIADALREVAEAGRKLLASGLNERTIVLLVTDSVNRGASNKVGMGDVRRILRALPALTDYLSE